MSEPTPEPFNKPVKVPDTVQRGMEVARAWMLISDEKQRRKVYNILMKLTGSPNRL